MDQSLSTGHRPPPPASSSVTHVTQTISPLRTLRTLRRSNLRYARYAESTTRYARYAPLRTLRTRYAGFDRIPFGIRGIIWLALALLVTRGSIVTRQSTVTHSLRPSPQALCRQPAVSASVRLLIDTLIGCRDHLHTLDTAPEAHIGTHDQRRISARLS